MNDQDEINPYQPPETIPESPDSLMKAINESAAGTAYPTEAFLFLLRGFEFAKTHVAESETRCGSHIDAVDLCWCLHDLAMFSFGDQARQQLEQWNLKSTRDFGEVVFRMIDTGLAKNQEGEGIEEFDDVFDFDHEFKPPDLDH